MTNTQTMTRNRAWYARRNELVTLLNQKIEQKNSTYTRSDWIKALHKELGAHPHPGYLSLYLPFSPGFSSFMADWQMVSHTDHKLILCAPVDEDREIRLVINKEQLRAVLWSGLIGDKDSYEQLDVYKGGDAY